MKLHPNTTVRDVPGKGRGVFAVKDIPGGPIIAEYLGTIRKADDFDYGGQVYDMWYSDTVSICPDPTTEGAHLINHSCEGNCGIGSIGRRTVIFAMRKVFAGEELTYDYFLSEQESDDKPAAGNCKCGSALCRGTMYSNPTQFALWDKFVDKEMEGLSDDPPVPYGEELPPLDAYPDFMPDNPLLNLFGAREQKPHEIDSGSFPSADELRNLIRVTGRQLAFPKLGIVVEGVWFDGKVVCSKD
jgi:uncharacterized protein